MRYYLGLDVGTTGIKGVLIDEHRQTLVSENMEHRQFFPQPGWVEQDPMELLNNCLTIVAALMRRAGLNPGQVQALGLSHQGESCLIWDKKTGLPVYPVITWQDRRMAAQSDAYARHSGGKIMELTGLRPDSYYSAWKWRWLLDHMENGQKRAENGELMAGTLNTWLIYKMTGGKSFVTDESSSSVTMLSDPRIPGWNDWLLEQMGIPKCILPEVLPADAMLGWTDPEVFPAGQVQIRSSLVDSSAGIIAANLPKEGGIVTSYGTGNFMHLTTGDRFVPAAEGLTSSCCYSTGFGKVCQLNGINYTAGSAIKWLQNELRLFQDVSEIEPLVTSVPDCGGVFFVPALSGLATPFWDQSARGAFLGMTAGTNRAHIIRAVLESSALQVANCFGIMKRVSGVQIDSMVAMGGMTKNSFLMQLQADLIGVPVLLPMETEPAYGAACFAACGYEGTDPAYAGFKNQTMRSFEPKMSQDEREEKIGNWCYAAKRSLNWYPEG